MLPRGPGAGFRAWNLQPRQPSARLECFVSCRARLQAWSHTGHINRNSRHMGTRLRTECQLQVYISSFCTGWAPGSGTRFPESPDETLESSIGLSLLGSHQRNDRGTQKNRRERPLVPSVVADFKWHTLGHGRSAADLIKIDLPERSSRTLFLVRSSGLVPRALRMKEFRFVGSVEWAKLCSVVFLIRPISRLTTCPLRRCRCRSSGSVLESCPGLRHMPAPDILNRLAAGGQAQNRTARSAQYCTVFETCQTPRLSSVHKLVSTSDCHFGSGLPGRGAQ